MAQIGELTNLRDLLPTTDDRELRRGEIYYVDLEGVEYCSQYVKRKTRPALIIQNDRGNQSANTVIVALITHQYNKPYPFQFRTRINGNESTIQFNQIMTLDKFRVLNKLTEMTPEQMEGAEQALMYNLALDRFSLENVLGFDIESKITKQTRQGTVVFFTFHFDLDHGGPIRLQVPASALTEFDPVLGEGSGLETVRKSMDNCQGLHWIVTHKKRFEL